MLRPLLQDVGDQNRTSPFALTGNRLEFRAAGSSQSIAGPLTALNMIVAESLDYIASRLEAAPKDTPVKFNTAVRSVLKEVIRENERVIYNGDNYAKKWHREAGRRGLPKLRSSVDALPVLAKPEVRELFEKYRVLTRRELESRYEIYLERYV